MTRVTITKDKNGRFTSLKCSGHAEYGEYGEDIVCAAISVLVTNTLNSIIALTSNELEASMDEDTADVSARFITCDDKCQLLVDSMIIGLNDVESTYGNEFLKLEIKEEVN